MDEVRTLMWREKYRPKTLDDIVLDEETREKFREMITQGNVPDLLLHGRAGTGKTSLAKIIINSLDCESIEINSSMDRGIQVVRDRVVSFSVARSTKRWRIVLFEEFDGATPDCQQSLRNLMEMYNDRVRFILTCNYPSKVIDPIRSRCTEIEFKSLSNKECVRRLKAVLDAEGVQYGNECVLQAVELCNSDMRSMLNLLQQSTRGGTLRELRKETNDGAAIIEALKKKDIAAIRSMAYRIDHTACYRYIFDNVAAFELDVETRADRMLQIAEYLFRDASIADRELNFIACCTALINKDSHV
jgi:DNA polymerase III delta prime subunit